MAGQGFMEPGRASFIYGGQFGSEGKGLAGAWVARTQGSIDIAVSNASANAGHTAVMEDGTKIVTRHLPMAAVVKGCRAYLSAGSIIDPDVLLDEIGQNNMRGGDVIIHPNAAVISQEDIEWEKENLKNGSTAKGVGRALANKIMRRRSLALDSPPLKPFLGVIDLNYKLMRHDAVLVEVPQGFSLSINGPFYPFCTSRDCTVMAAMSDAGIHPEFVGHVMGVFRAYPIRVGGTSGPCYDDQAEISWGDLGVTPEITTVTKRVRRVFTWSRQQFKDSCKVNRPDWILLTHTDYYSTDDTTQREAMIPNRLMRAILTDYYNSIERDNFVLLKSDGPKVSDVNRMWRSTTNV